MITVICCSFLARHGDDFPRVRHRVCGGDRHLRRSALLPPPARRQHGPGHRPHYAGGDVAPGPVRSAALTLAEPLLF